MKARLTQRETNDLIFRLEERRFGRRLNSMELAQKANVSLDDVNRVEKQIPLESEEAAARIAKALGITVDLLRKIAGYEEMSNEDLNQVDACLAAMAEEQAEELKCEAVGLKPAP